MSLENYRLPKAVVPTNYKLYIESNLDKFTFKGSVMIDINVMEKRDTIILNSKNLVIESATFDGNNVPFDEDKSNEIIILRTDPIKIGSHYIAINFNGYINDQMEGFYRSKYKLNGETRYMATTQFQSADARQAFPCFDEPNFKATFDITINGPIDKTILCNTPIKSVKKYEDVGRKSVTFETTPLMSTYIVAFIISDLEYLEGETFNGIKIRVYATPEHKSKLQFSLDVAIKSLEWYIKWFEIDYPLPKLDMVAIPDFSAGAMENWGLVTYREGAMLCDDNTNLNEKQDIVNTICHELAHQWFGNLVTMEWWTYLWLNESMATYFAWMLTDILFPEWQIWNKFMEQEYMTALELDSLETSHPIEVPVQKVSDAQQIFDAISYSKGSCLIRFLVDYMGMDEFQKGMRKYLNKNKYGNTVSDDLWDAFGNNIGKLMTDWTKQTGYPVIFVKCINSKDLVLSQSRFYKYGPSMNKDKEQIWTIPLDMKVSNSKIMSVVLDKMTSTFTIDNCSDILMNPNMVGFYRVKYVEPPNMKNLSDEQRIHLINDSFSLSTSGYQNFSDWFNIINRLDLPAEKNYYVWSSIVGHINNLYSLLRYHKDIKKQYRVKLMIPLYKPLESIINQLGWEDRDNESVNDHEMRELTIDALATTRNRIIIDEALNRFRNDKWLSRKTNILPIVGRYGTPDDYNKLLKIYEANTNPQMTDSLISAFGAVRNPKLIEQSLDLALSDKIREQDLWFFIRCLSMNDKTCDLVWDLVTSNWGKFMKKYPPGSQSLTYLVKSMAAGFLTEEQLNKYKKFFKDNLINGIEMSVNQTIEKTESKIKTTQRMLNDEMFKSLIQK